MSGRGSKPMKWNCEWKRSPWGGSSPRRIARTQPTYSRISLSGLSIDWPYQLSTTGRCETPSPMIARPPEYSSSVPKDWAVVTGMRE
jgi:hypothetical protein